MINISEFELDQLTVSLKKLMSSDLIEINEKTKIQEILFLIPQIQKNIKENMRKKRFLADKYK